MALHRFFIRQPLTADASGALDENQARQALSVLRLRPGDRIVVFDGSGTEAEATLSSVHKREVRFQVGDVYFPERETDLNLTIGLALLRGDRFEVAVQKLTEIGVHRIVPLAAERCVVSFPDARDWDKRAVRYERIITEALEQSERVTSVELSAPSSVQDFLNHFEVLTLVERGKHASVATVPLKPVMAVAIGPEGGWSEGELQLIEEYSMTASLGHLILRAETAAIVSAGTLIQRSYASRS